MKKCEKMLIYSIFAITVLIFVPSLADAFNLPKFVWISFITILLIGLFLKKSGKEIKFNKKIFLLPLSLILFWQILCFSKSINVFESITITMKFFVFFVFYIFITEIIEKEEIEKIMKFFVFASVLVSIYGFLQVAGIDFIKWSIKNSPLSTLGRRNFAAEFLVVIIPYTFALIVLSKKKVEKIIYFSILSIFLIHLVFTFTRASYLGFIFSFLVFLFILKKIRLPEGKKIVLIILIIFSLTTFAKTFEKGSVKSRILIWKTTLNMIKKNPLMGVGPGNFKINYLKYCIGKKDVLTPVKENVEDVHNDFLEITAETGIIGLLLFLFLLFRIFRTGFCKQTLLTAASVSSISGMLVNCLASFPFKNPATLFIFFLNLSFLDLIFRKGKYKVKISKEIIFIFFIIYSISVIIIDFHAISGNFYYSLCKKYEKAKPAFALEMGKKSIMENPYNYKPYFICGKIYLSAGKIKEAIIYLKESEKLYPYLDTLQNNIGIAYFKAGNYQMAEKHYLLSLSMNKNRPETYNNLGFLYLEKGNIEKGIKFFEKAIKLCPSFYLSYFNLGMAYFEKKDYRKAEKNFKKVLEIKPEFFPARIYLKKIKNLKIPGRK